MEIRSIDYVPLAERRGDGRGLWPIWFTGSTNMTTLAVGLIGVGTGGGLAWSALAILAGCAFGTLIVALHAAQGPKLGLPQLIQARSQFGYYGAMPVYLVALISYAGYNAFGQIQAGQSLNVLSGLPEKAGGIATSLIALAIALFGFPLFRRLQHGLALALVAGLGLYSVELMRILPDPTPGPFRPAPFLLQAAAAATYQLSWSLYISDYSRYLPPNLSARRIYWWTFSGAFLGGAWGMLLGAATAATGSDTSLADALARIGDLLLPGFGPALLGLLLAGLISTGALNFYGASLTLLSLADTIRPLRPGPGKRCAAAVAVGIATLGLALAASDHFLRGFSAFLDMLLDLVTPWIAITLVDFYLVRRGRYAVRALLRRSALYGGWNGRGLGSYALGFMLSLSVHPLAGLAGAGAAYRLLTLKRDAAAEDLHIAELDRGLEAEGG